VPYLPRAGLDDVGTPRSLGIMTDIEEAGTHAEIRERVRRSLAWKLEELMKDLKPYVNGDMGEILPGHVNVFLTAVKLQAGLWQAMDAPEPEDGVLTPAKVNRMLEAARIEAAEHAIAEERSRVARDRVLALESAGSAVRDKLKALRSPGPSV
jgi:hypothetical protein